MIIFLNSVCVVHLELSNRPLVACNAMHCVGTDENGPTKAWMLGPSVLAGLFRGEHELDGTHTSSIDSGGERVRIIRITAGRYSSKKFRNE